MIDGKHGQGSHITKMGADKSAENIPQKFICPIPKVFDFDEKRLHRVSVVRVMYLMWNVKWNETWAYFKLTQGAFCNQNKKEGNCQHKYLPIYVTKKVLLFFMFSFATKEVLLIFIFSFAFNFNAGIGTQFFAISGFISAASSILSSMLLSLDEFR